MHVYSQLEYQRQNDDEITSETESEDTVETVDTSVITDEINNGEMSQANSTYPMQSHRRMRSKELHYIDHPLVGILIQINPVEINQIEQPEQANAAQYLNVALIYH